MRTNAKAEGAPRSEATRATQQRAAVGRSPRAPGSAAAGKEPRIGRPPLVTKPARAAFGQIAASSAPAYAANACPAAPSVRPRTTQPEHQSGLRFPRRSMPCAGETTVVSGIRPQWREVAQRSHHRVPFRTTMLELCAAASASLRGRPGFVGTFRAFAWNYCVLVPRECVSD